MNLPTEEYPYTISSEIKAKIDTITISNIKEATTKHCRFIPEH